MYRGQAIFKDKIFKKKLLKNVEEVEQLTLPIVDFPKKRMIYVENLSIYYNPR